MIPPKAMLAAKGPDIETLKNWPYILEPKIDGIRCLIAGDAAYGRSGKLLPNKCLQRLVREEVWHTGLDGELLYRENYSATVSAVMSHHYVLNENLVYHVFDDWIRGEDSRQWNSGILRYVGGQDWHYSGVITVRRVPSVEVLSPDDIRASVSTDWWSKNSPEGYILRSLEGKYKHGRSTVREELLLKYKNFEDGEARIIGTVPLYVNENEPEKDPLGYQTRSSSKEGKVRKDTLGALVCVLEDGREFKIGTGFDQLQRLEYWVNRDQLIGQYVKFTHLPVGAKDLPRFPVFKGFRDPIDM